MKINQTNAFPLTLSRVGESVKLVNVNASSKVVQRLAALGMTPGVTMTVVQDNGGSIVLALRGSRLALGRQLTQRVFVEPM